MEQQFYKQARQVADRFIQFVNKGVTPYHVVDECRVQLMDKGFKELKESQDWSLELGQKYFLTQNNSTLIAFTTPLQMETSKLGFKIIGTHTDSPVLKLAPNSVYNKNNYRMGNLQTYGGGLWHTWFDRPLNVGGKVVIRSATTNRIEEKTWNSNRSMAIIPNLAIHLQTMQEREKFGYNKETHLKPIWSTIEVDKMNGLDNKDQRHYYGLLNEVSKDLQVDVDQILDFDLQLYDTNESRIIGNNEELIHSSRIDNLYSTFCALQSIISEDSHCEGANQISMIAMFDHEECGSESAQGAASVMMYNNLQRISNSLLQCGDKQDINIRQILHNSFMVSADMAHSLHPNYIEKHQSCHQPLINKGVVIKTNENQRYTTDCVSRTILREICRLNHVRLQDVIVRNDSPCGSTIGPIMATRLGVKSIDVGAPMLAMHSIKEMAGVLDILDYLRMFQGFFKHYETIQHGLFDR